MTAWRPFPEIRVKALGLHWRDGRLLAFDVRDDSGRVKGVRPLGGSVRFGESARNAVMREFREELGTDVSVLGEPFVMENLYAHEGATGHEVLFLFEVAIPGETFKDRDHIVFYEDDGTRCDARWHDLDDLDVPDRPALYPEGLKPLLIAARGERGS